MEDDCSQSSAAEFDNDNGLFLIDIDIQGSYTFGFLSSRQVVNMAKESPASGACPNVLTARQYLAREGGSSREFGEGGALREELERALSVLGEGSRAEESGNCAVRNAVRGARVAP